MVVTDILKVERIFFLIVCVYCLAKTITAINYISKLCGCLSLIDTDKMFYPGKKCLYCLMMMMRAERLGEAGLVYVSTGHSVVTRPLQQPHSQLWPNRRTATSSIVQTYKNNKEMETIRKLLPAFKVC